MSCKHIEIFQSKILGKNIVITYKNGNKTDFLGYTCIFCPKCGERVRADPARKRKTNGKEKR